MGRIPRWNRFAACLLALVGWACVVLPASAGAEGDRAQAKPDQRVKLPGLVIDLDAKTVDLRAKVAVDDELLETVACIVDTKEHESLVVIEASPTHVHAALLMLGLNPGHPYTVKRSEQDPEKFLHLPPKGDAVVVSLVIKGEDGEAVERPISDFIRGKPLGGKEAEGGDQDKAKDRFPDTFVFAGSLVEQDEQGNKRYLAEESGHVITISTFGDDLLCLPEHVTDSNDQLFWHADPTHLPGVGEAVTLRLRPKAKVKAEAADHQANDQSDSNTESNTESNPDDQPQPE